MFGWFKLDKILISLFNTRCVSSELVLLTLLCWLWLVFCPAVSNTIFLSFSFLLVSSTTGY